LKGELAIHFSSGIFVAFGDVHPLFGDQKGRIRMDQKRSAQKSGKVVCWHVGSLLVLNHKVMLK
jgi:hypothetical protein